MNVDDIIADVERLDLQPGDHVLLRVGHPLTQDQVEQMRATLKQALPDHKALILDAGMTLEKLSVEQSVEQRAEWAAQFSAPHT